MSLDDMQDRIEDLENRLVATEESLHFLCTAVLMECPPDMAQRVKKRHLDFILLAQKFQP